MSISISSIFGVSVGFEFVPTEIAEEEGALWGFVLDLFFIRVVGFKLAP